MKNKCTLTYKLKTINNLGKFKKDESIYVFANGKDEKSAVDALDELAKKEFGEFSKKCENIVNTYLDELRGDVSWFCKKFDYRYDAEPWYNSKDSVERAMRFLRSDLHKEPAKQKKNI